jgi:predicted RNA-binding Zn-ribbon protein involved in translation (DUF1610 family)
MLVAIGQAGENEHSRIVLGHITRRSISRRIVVVSRAGFQPARFANGRRPWRATNAARMARSASRGSGHMAHHTRRASAGTWSARTPRAIAFRCPVCGHRWIARGSVSRALVGADVAHRGSFAFTTTPRWTSLSISPGSGDAGVVVTKLCRRW